MKRKIKIKNNNNQKSIQSMKNESKSNEKWHTIKVRKWENNDWHSKSIKKCTNNPIRMIVNKTSPKKEKKRLDIPQNMKIWWVKDVRKESS